MQLGNDHKTKRISYMTAKAKTILSSLYELGDNPYGLVCKWFTPPPANR